jgi:hypothetical protein
MPRFFFDADDGISPRDEAGIECLNLDIAIGEAIRTLPALIAQASPNDIDDRIYAVVIRDESGRPLYRAEVVFSGTRL